MYKVYVLLLVVILIIIIGNMFITREGFYQEGNNDNGEDDVVPSTQSDTEIECTFETRQVKDDCNKIVTNDKDEFTVHNVCPLNPKCLGTCVNDFTWTKENKQELGMFDKPRYKIGHLKSNDEKLKALFKSSRCMECIKNFYTGIELIHSNVGCERQP
jgi:hypothetical protein